MTLINPFSEKSSSLSEHLKIQLRNEATRPQWEENYTFIVLWMGKSVKQENQIHNEVELEHC